jgi:hypothetical protein
VEAISLRSRIEAVAVLRQVLKWNSPIATFFLWRRPFRSGHQQRWQKLAHLAAVAISDYPIVPLATAPLFGTSAFHVAICRGPRLQVR